MPQAFDRADYDQHKGMLRHFAKNRKDAAPNVLERERKTKAGRPAG
jgi:hypothetical protein